MSDLSLKPAPVWPLLVAPIVAIFYYSALKLAFGMSLGNAVGDIGSDLQMNLDNFGHGSHWIYRGVGELSSVSLAVYLASGLARGRSVAAGIIAGCTISVSYLAPIIWLALVQQDFLWGLVAINRWYQMAIDGAVILGSPYVGFKLSEAARDVVRANPVGFDGVNCLHFIWLWIAVLGYGGGLIGPFVRFYTRQFEFGPGDIFGLVGAVISMMPLFIPAYYGLGLLSRRIGVKLKPVARNTLGVIVLAVGFAVGTAIQYGLYLFFHWLTGK